MVLPLHKARWPPSHAAHHAVAAALLAASALTPRTATAGAPSILQPTTPVERAIAPGETHHYQVTVPAGHFFHLTLEPTAVVPVLTVTDPRGATQGKVRDAAGLDDPIGLSVVADTAGTYRIEVSAGPAGASGRYRLVLESARPATAPDRTRMSAEKQQFEAGELARRNTAEARREALRAYGAALDLWRAVGDGRAEGQALSEMGEVHFALGDTASAVKCWQKAQALASAAGDRRGEARATENLAVAASVAGDQEGARAAYERILPVYREAGARWREAGALHNIAAAYRNEGNPARALEYYEQALSLERELKDPRGEANTLVGVGTAYTMLGAQHRSLEAYERALRPARASGDGGLEAAVLGRLGAQWMTLGDPAEARRAFEAGLQISRRAGDGFREARALTSLGTALRVAGDYPRARATFTQALELRRAQGDRPSQAELLVELAIVARAMGEAAESEKALREALALYHARGEPRDEGYVRLELAALDQERGEIAAAIEGAQAAVELMHGRGDLGGEAMSLYRLALAHHAQGDLPAALRDAQDAIARLESLRARISGPPWRVAYFATVQDLYDFYVALLMQLDAAHPGEGFAVRAFEASEAKRARGLLDFLIQMRADAAGKDADQRQAEVALQGRLEARLQRQIQLLTVRPRDPAAAHLAGEIESLLTDYGRRPPAGIDDAAAGAVPRDGARGIQEHLDDETVLLEFSLGEPLSYGWAVTRHEVFGARLPSRHELEAAARAPYEQVSRPPYHRPRPVGPGSAAEAATTLSRLLLTPFRQRLQASRILIVPDGILHYVPFAALPVSATGEPGGKVPLASAHLLVVLPSASTAALLATSDGVPGGNKTVAVFADPVFESDDPRLAPVMSAEAAKRAPRAAPPDEVALEGRLRTEGLPRLPFSRREADAIGDMAPPGSVLRAVGFDANRSAALRPILADYRVVHFATHGLLDDQHPELSGIVLSLYDPRGRPRDGLLRLEDIHQMRLAADLVVLSACRTALGKEQRGEGLTGLVRAFMYAGAARVMASQWSVDDRATAALMREFYRGLLLSHLRPAEALRQAQMRVRARPGWRDPFYWAGFVLTGGWP